MQNNQPCIWATRKELWSSLLNDPELGRLIDSARVEESAPDKTPAGTSSIAANEQDQSTDDQNIGARLRAYETPITDDILRQSIR